MVKINTAMLKILKSGGSLLKKERNKYKFKLLDYYIMVHERNGEVSYVGINTTGKENNSDLDYFYTVNKAINWVKSNR